MAVQRLVRAIYHSSWYSCREKAGNMLGDHLSIFLERKVTSIQQMDLAVWQILLERLCTVGSKDGIILAPHGQERRLMLPEVLLPLCIALQIGAIVFQEGQLDAGIARTLQPPLLKRPRTQTDMGLFAHPPGG